MKPVNITIETTFDKDSSQENKMVFYTEGEMEPHQKGFVYTYDESALFDNATPISGLLEIGPDFVVRTMQGEDRYIMNFKEGLREKMTYETPYGSFTTQIFTKKVDVKLQEGIGNARILYLITLADQDQMLTEVNITIGERQQ